MEDKLLSIDIKEVSNKEIKVNKICSDKSYDSTYKIHEKDEGYILDILKEEEERLTIKLGSRLSDYERYLFFRYVSVRDAIDKLKHQIA